MNKKKAKLDRLFSKFIKLRDCGQDYFKCISCNKVKPKEQFNAGHFWSRQYMSTRYDEKNVNGQCIYCNFHLKGHIQGYAVGLVRKYGEGVLRYLEIKKNNVSKMGTFEYDLLIDHYNSKIKDLKK
tara:strand:+ start:88 stop:465 length:378 start_codon:yes stop_codon:yes gene_type:complete